MPHPEARGGGDRLASTSPNKSIEPKNPLRTLILYSQCQIFTDFLISRTGETAILRKLVDKIGRNEDYLTMLVREIAIESGQDTIEDADSMFLRWVQAYAPPEGKAKIG